MQYSSPTVLFLIISIIAVIAITPALSFADHHMMTSPRKQMESGIAATDVVCKPGLALMIRTSGDAICVKSSSVEKLTASGFATLEKTESVIPDDVSDIKDDQMETSVNPQDIISGKSIHADFPTIETLTVTHANQIDPKTYILEYEITGGDKNLDLVLISVHSDIETIHTEIPGLPSHSESVQRVIINANDPSSITASIQSYN